MKCAVSFPSHVLLLFPFENRVIKKVENIVLERKFFPLGLARYVLVPVAAGDAGRH